VQKQPAGSLAHQVGVLRVAELACANYRTYLCSSQPILCDSSLFSAGTRCYIGKSTDGVTVIIKDCWVDYDPNQGEYTEVDGGPRSRGRLSVVNKFIMKDQITVASDIDMLVDASSVVGENLKKRVHGRVVYKPLTVLTAMSTTWNNPRELVAIMADSLEGHAEVYQKGSLHSNVATSTIFMSGDRGYLVDWDLGT